MHQNRALFLLSLGSLVLVYLVVVLGAYVRLSDAGLGCPDWPGCYGNLLVPADGRDAAPAYTDAVIHQGKAWKEMIHRYAAGLLGLMIFALAGVAWRQRARGAPARLAGLLAALVIFQAVLGMWTVTWLLKPVVVMAHLLGGMTILALLFWLAIRQLFLFNNADTDTGLRPWVWAGLGILVLQIALGGWTSANYAALACPDFPACRDGAWVPPVDFGEGFTLWHGLGMNYEGGILDGAARTAIHLAHRAGAVLALLALGALALRALWSRVRLINHAGVVVLLVLFVQLALGVANVVLVLPLSVAVAHNGVAALLLLSVVALLYLSRPKPMLFKSI